MAFSGRGGTITGIKLRRHTEILLVAAIGVLAALAWIVPSAAATEISYTRIDWTAVHVKHAVVVPKPAPVALSAAQEAWIDRLEACESQNDPTAINPKDRDGTPSYYSFQFKPATFRSFGEAYKVLPRGLTHDELMEALKRRDLQRAIVSHMIGDPSVRWGSQFPDCVRIHIGLPPGVAGTL